MGEDISSVTIKDKIRKMIEAEDPFRPLSDSRIAELLGSEGLPLARRTVAKYREELRHPAVEPAEIAQARASDRRARRRRAAAATCEGVSGELNAQRVSMSAPLT